MYSTLMSLSASLMTSMSVPASVLRCPLGFLWSKRCRRNGVSALQSATRARCRSPSELWS
ncbi:hypothetical protein PF001_g30843 [Phytophthora fragariae]|uniref:Uncharacterized protein n=1 Tax=Phytophthora fragariae TaxID=53985 RepID=A0A6A3DIJ7_9STRA|nr:hypothetical protein PF009_g28976 [Phytophthora fragariae]KAE9265545.1 hypothetical protein PF001_g30843 [Phytophthora fragariae]